MKPFKVEIITDGGPWAEHNFPCPVYVQSRSAVYNLNTCVFEPSWTAQKDGWMTIRATGWKARAIRLIMGIPKPSFYEGADK